MRMVAGGGGWIRTIVGVSQQIYSLPPLATRAPLRSERSLLSLYKTQIVKWNKKRNHILSTYT